MLLNSLFFQTSLMALMLGATVAHAVEQPPSLTAGLDPALTQVFEGNNSATEPLTQKQRLQKDKKKGTAAALSSKEIIVPTKSKPYLNKSADNTPPWLRMDHVRFTSPIKEIKNPHQRHPFFKAMESAYNTNGKIKSQLRSYYATAETVSQALSGWRPDITGTLSTGYTSTEGYLPPNGSKYKRSLHPKVASVTVQQNLFAGGGTVAATEAAENRLRAARAVFLNIEQATLFNAINSYLGLWAARESLIITKNSENFFKESLDQAQAQLEVGENSITDVALARFNYQNTEAQRRAAEQAVKTAEAAYVQNIGEPAPAVLVLPLSAFDIMTIPPNLKLFLENATKYNPAIIGSEYTHLAAKNDIDSANAALLPSVNLSGTLDRQLEAKEQGGRQNDASLTLSLTLPFYTQGGINWSRSRQNSQTAAQTKHDIKTSRDQVLYDANRTWETAFFTKRQVQELKIAIQAGKQMIEGARQQYLVGELPLIDVFQSQNQVQAALTALVNAQQNYISASYEMLAVIGELTPETLQLGVTTYDLNTYPEAVRNKWIGWEGAPSDRRGPVQNVNVMIPQRQNQGG